MASANEYVFGKAPENNARSFATVKEAYDDPIIKNGLLTIFKEQVQAMDSDNYTGVDLAKEDLADTIYNYPKVIFEPNSITTERGVIASAFNEVGQVRLPFPKMTVITASDVDMGNQRITSILPIYLVQDNDSVITYIVTNRLGGVDVCAFRFYLKEYGEAGSNLLLTEVLLSSEHVKRVGEKRVQALCGFLMYVVTRTIYMMTISGGEIYMSTPTSADASTNAKRIRKNKKPLIEFRMVVIDGKKSDSLKSIPHGTHASPRQHWRRGHYRTTPKGKKVWIDPMLVGDEKNGKIIKDYAVGKYEREMNDRPR